MRVQVIFATSGLQVADLEVDSSMTVLALQHKVAAATNVPATRQQLLRGTEVLRRRASLEQTGVVNSDTLQLVVNPHMVCLSVENSSRHFVKICCATTGEWVETLDGRGPEFTEDGSMVLTQTAQDAVTICNTSTWTCVQTLTAQSKISYKNFFRDGSLVLTYHYLAEDMTVRIWSVSSGACLSILEI